MASLKSLDGVLSRLSRILVVFLMLCPLIASVSSQMDIRQAVKSEASKILCEFYGAFRTIATGIALMVFVIAGVKWVASENDAGARKAAKDAIIHAIIGLILITLIYYLIAAVVGDDPAKMLCGTLGKAP